MASTNFNDTLTSIKRYSISSRTILEVRDRNYSEQFPHILHVPNIFDYGYLYSIELKRAEVKKQLTKFYDCEGFNDELDFIAANSDLIQILPVIGEFLLDKLNAQDKITLELLNEDPDWKTIFINIQTSLSWEESNNLTDKIFEYLFVQFPDSASKVNFCISPT